LLFARLPWLNPRLHPWRFTAAIGLLVGVLLVIAKMQEGLPPNIAIGLLVAGIFISVELGSTLMGFAIFGGYLGLRPPLLKKNLSV
jgi:nicotinamide riboside transporter PnuC